MISYPAARYGFRVLGGAFEQRRLTESAAAFAAHCAADPRAEPGRECYLSLFDYGEEFREFLARTGSTRGYAGPTWSLWLWFDIDRPDNGAAFDAARRLAGHILHRYPEFDEDDLLPFFSGQKGVHLGVPLTHRPPPSPVFYKVCRHLAETLAAGAGVQIDTGIYDRVRIFRAPNSRHPKTGRHKVRLTHKEIMHLSSDQILALAREPVPFEVPVVKAVPPALVADWAAAERAAAEQAADRTGHHAPAARLQRATLDFIRHGAPVGQRNIRLFRSAANLRELEVPERAIAALLAEAALDCGLPPAEVRQTIDSGIAHVDDRAAGKGGDE